MRKILLAAIGMCLLAINAWATNSVEAKKILISKVVDHPALNATEQGIIDALAAGGYFDGKNLIILSESAQGSPVLANQIAAKFVNQNPNVIVGIGTISAQTFAKFAQEKRIKLIFSTVSDPFSAGLILPGNNISGVSNFVPIKPQLELFKQLQPNLKTIGVIYNPGEENSVSIVKKIEEEAVNCNIKIIKKVATRTSEVAQTATSLAQKVDAIFISNDNTSLSALQSVIKVAENNKIPVYVSDTDAVALGAVAALGPNQYMVGQQTGKMIVRILNGEDINSQKVEFPNEIDLYINLDAAKKTNITVPKHLVDSATKVITSD
jgi:putative ABC transport system substrate-binding protein